MSAKINKGVIQIYRVFDVAEEILLSKAEKLLASSAEGPRLRLPADTRKAIIMKDAPLSIKLGQVSLKLPSGEYPVNAFARMWNYGVISIRFEMPMPKGIDWDDLVLLAAQIETVPEIDRLAALHRDALREKLAPAIIKDRTFGISEDYITYIVESADGMEKPKEFINSVDVAGLILAETRKELSPFSKNKLLDSAMQYASTDLAIIDWNSALLLEPEGERDVADVIEFSLTQLLEFRYYDDLIENNLQELYDSMDNKPKGIKALFNNFYSEKAEDSSRKYIEFSEFMSRVENSLKTIGDAYLAVIFRNAARQFRFDDWRHGISNKMSTLAEITQMLHGEVNVKRSHWLEIIVIILIAIELIPMIVNLYHFTKTEDNNVPAPAAIEQPAVPPQNVLPEDKSAPQIPADKDKSAQPDKTAKQNNPVAGKEKGR